MIEATDLFAQRMFDTPYVTTLSDGTTTVTLDSATYTAAWCTSTFSIGNACSASFSGTCPAQNFPWLVGDQVTLTTALTTPTSTLGAVTLGVFTLSKVERQTDTDRISLTGVDAMAAALEQTFVSPNAERPPSTTQEVLEVLADQCGLTFVGTDLIPETTMRLTFDAAGMSSATMREVVAALALLGGANAVIDRQGRLAFCRANQTQAVVSGERYYESGLTLNAQPFVFGALSVTVPTTVETENGSEEVQTVYAEQLSGYTQGLSCTSPYFTQAIFDAVWKAWKGFTFRPGSVSMLGDPRLEVGDEITVRDRTGDTYEMLITAIQSSFDGGWKTTLTAAGLEEQTVSTQTQSVSQAISGLKTQLGRFQYLYADNLSATRAEINHLTSEDIVGEHGTINLKDGTFSFGDALSWDGETLQVKGDITATTGSVGGWTIQPDRLSSQPWRGYDTDDAAVEADAPRIALYPGRNDESPAIQFSGYTGTAIIEPVLTETSGALESLDLRRGGGYVRLTDGAVRLGEQVSIPGSLTLGAHSSPVGSVVTDSFSAVSVPSGTITQLVSLTLGAGSWVVTCANYWNSRSSSGVRILNLSTSATALQGQAICQEAAAGQITRQQVTWVGASTSANFTLYALAQQDSGSAVGVSGSLCALRLA